LILVDANLLLYAYHPRAEQHEKVEPGSKLCSRGLILSLRLVSLEKVELNYSDPRGSRNLHCARRPDAVQRHKRCVGQIRFRPGNAAEDNEAFLVGNGANGVDHCSRRRLAEQSHQGGPSLAPTHPAERASRFPRHGAISVVEQLRQ
jgi:hypothetical protein